MTGVRLTRQPAPRKQEPTVQLGGGTAAVSVEQVSKSKLQSPSGTLPSDQLTPPQQQPLQPAAPAAAPAAAQPATPAPAAQPAKKKPSLLSKLTRPGRRFW